MAQNTKKPTTSSSEESQDKLTTKQSKGAKQENLDTNSVTRIASAERENTPGDVDRKNLA